MGAAGSGTPSTPSGFGAGGSAGATAGASFSTSGGPSTSFSASGIQDPSNVSASGLASSRFGVPSSEPSSQTGGITGQSDVAGSQLGGVTGQATSNPAGSASIGTNAVGAAEVAGGVRSPESLVSANVSADGRVGSALGTASQAQAGIANPQGLAVSGAEGEAMGHVPVGAQSAVGDASMATAAARNPRGAVASQLSSEAPNESVGVTVSTDGSSSAGPSGSATTPPAGAAPEAPAPTTPGGPRKR